MAYSTNKGIQTITDALPRELARSSVAKKLCVIEFRQRVDGTPLATKTRCVTELFCEVRAKRNDAVLTLILIDAGWCRDNRLTRYYGFWKQLEREGYHFPKAGRSADGRIQFESCVEYWATLQLGERDVAEALRAMVNRDGVLLISFGEVDSEGVKRCIEKHVHAMPSAAVLACMEFVNESGGLCLHPVLTFDDPEISVYVLGARDLFELFRDVPVVDTKN